MTAIEDFSGPMPVAKALGSASGMRKTAGLGRPAAIAISSTTLSSIRCFGSRVSTGTACVDSSTALSPPASAHQAENPPRHSAPSVAIGIPGPTPEP